MGRFFKRLAKMTGRAIVWFGAFLLLVIILSQISLWIGLLWLNSSKGQGWTQDKIDIALKDSGYRLKIDQYRYTPLTSLYVKKIEISDQKGIIASIENAKLHINIISLALRDLSLILKSEKAVLHRLPESEEPLSENKSTQGIYLQAFQFPDLYFDKLDISNISIDNLEIAPEVAGQALSFSPFLSGALAIEENELSVNLSLKPDTEKLSNITGLPEKITVDTTINTDTALVTLNDLKVLSGLYDVEAKGEAVLREEGAINIETTASAKNMKAVDPVLEGSFESEWHITGTQQALIINANGVLDLLEFKNRGLSPVKFTAVSDLSKKQADELPPVDLTVSSAYLELPVELKTVIQPEGNIIHLDKIEGNAPDLALTGDVDIDTETTIATGKVSAEINKISTYAALLKTDIGGAGKIDVELLAGENGQSAKVETDLQQITYDTVKADNLQLSATFPDIKNYWPIKATLKLNNMQIAGLVLKQLNATIDQKDTADYGLTAKGSGSYDIPFAFDITSDISGLETSQPQARNIKAALKVKDETLHASGSVNLSDIDLTIETKSLLLAQIVPQLPEAAQQVSVDGKAHIKGPMNSPVLDANVSLSSFNITDATADIKLDFKADYKEEKLAVAMTGRGDDIQTLNGNFNMPIRFSLNPFILDISGKQAVNGEINLSLQAGALSDAFLPPEQEFDGIVKSDIKIAGTLDNPVFRGNASIDNGHYLYEPYGVDLEDLTLKAGLSHDKITINTLTARDKEQGTMEVFGDISLSSYIIQNMSLAAKANNFHLLNSDLADGVFDADLKVSGMLNQFDITGSITPDYIDITIPERFQSSIPELSIVEKDEEINKLTDDTSGKLNIDFIAENRIFVRGWGLDAEFGGKLKIDGYMNDPQFTGTLKSLRGRYTEFGKRFELTKANLDFFGSVPPNPTLDIVAETQAEEITARVNLTGPVEKPQIGFSSTPALPEDEILARILFGRDLSSISPFQAIKLAQTIRRFSGKGGGGFDPLDKIREAAGFDDLRVDTSEGGETSVGVGKYLTDKVYLEFEKGNSEGSGAANLEVEVTPNITVESEVGQDAQAGGGVFWEWDY